jgi:hypothetical protein
VLPVLMTREFKQLQVNRVFKSGGSSRRWPIESLLIPVK